MKNILTPGSIVCLWLFAIPLEAQYCTADERFTEAAYFAIADIATDTGRVYGNANDYEGHPQELKMDVWYPSAAADPLSERPFILLIHGGGFSTGNRAQMSVECRRFAQSGYVAATLSYRLGWDASDSLDGDFVAAYRAQQDAHAALRYIVEHAEAYGIDTSWMFMGGISAGAGTSLNTVFVNEAEWEAAVPGIVSRWGNLNTSGNSLTSTFNIQAVYNNCGLTSQAAIKPEDMVPVISFHGYLDGIVPIGSTPQGTAGSSVIHDSLIARGVCSEFTLDSLGNHCPHPRNFRVARTACFFKSILCSACTSHFFTEEVAASCSSTPLGLGDDVSKNLIHIHPNPASDYLTIRGEWGDYQIDMLSATGQLYQTLHVTGNLRTVDVSALPAGVYFLKVQKRNSPSFEVHTLLKD